jgi:hypothetical protein
MDNSNNVTCQDLYEFYLDFRYPVTGIPILEVMRNVRLKKGIKILFKKWVLKSSKVVASSFWSYNFLVSRFMCDKGIDWSLGLNLKLEEPFFIECCHRETKIEIKPSAPANSLKESAISQRVNLTPVVIFAFNRPKALKSLIASLETSINLDEFHFLFFIDGPRNSKDIPMILENKSIIENFRVMSKEIIEQDNNLGLHNSVISGVTAVFKTYDFAIILEDDLECQPELLSWFLKESRLLPGTTEFGGLCGYFPLAFANPVKGNFTSKRFHSWGWATRAENWSEINFSQSSLMQLAIDKHFRRKLFEVSPDLLPMAVAQLSGNVSSWAIKFIFSGVNLNLSYYFPGMKLVENNGFDSTATHTHLSPNSEGRKKIVYKDSETLSRSVRAYYA